MSTPADTGHADVGQTLADLLCLPVEGQPRESRRGRLSNRVVQGAIALVDEMDFLGMLDAWRDEDDPHRKAKGGAPAKVAERACLVVLIALNMAGEPTLVTRVAEALSSRLDTRMRHLLGLPTVESASDTAVYHRAYRCLHRIVAVIDPFPGKKGRRKTRAEVEELIMSFKTVNADGEEEFTPFVQTRMKRLVTLTNAILEASFQLLPPEVRRNWRGNLCIDATLVKVHGRAGSPSVKGRTDCGRDRMSPEYLAGWYTRHDDHRDPDTTRTSKKADKVAWGYEAHLAVMTANDPGTPPDFPLLALGMSLDKPAGRVAENALTAVASVAGRGHPAGVAAADLAYFPNSKPEKYQLPLRALGYRLLGDYRDDQLGVQAEHGGALLIEGHWYCPAIPDALRDASIDYRAGRITEAVYAARILQRARFLFRPKHAPTPDGNTAHMCPARGPGATATCPIATPKGPVGLGIPTIPPKKGNRPAGRRPKKTLTPIRRPPAQPDVCCKNTTSITFPTAPSPGVTPSPSLVAKHLQDFQYATPEWHAWYALLRNTVEGYNGFTKDPNGEALEEPGRRRVRGFAFQALLVAFILFASNLRKIQTFLRKRTEAPDPPALITAVSDSRKRRADLADYRPDPHGPPLAIPA